MPYVRKGKTVYKREAGRLVKKGSSSTVEGAKKYMKKLYMVEGERKKKKK